MCGTTGVMCSNNDPSAAAATALLPYGHVGQTNAYAALPPPDAALEHYRLQLYNYAYVDRFRYAHPVLASPYAAAVASYGSHHEGAAAAAFALSAAYAKLDPRCAYRVPEEPKPQHSYIGLIGMAILSSPDKKLVLSDIYQYILDNYAYFRTRGPGWRNSIRHNLSLNDCFIKAGRSANGKGHYWAIHPANVEDFKKGDFRRRKAQRRVRKHMGLSVPEDDDSPSSTPPPTQLPLLPPPAGSSLSASSSAAELVPVSSTTTAPKTRKRLFDVESLLAPDHPTKPPPTPDSECEEPNLMTPAEEGSPASSRKCSPDTTAEGDQGLLAMTRPWPCSPPHGTVWSGMSVATCPSNSRKREMTCSAEMTRWHDAVSRLLIRAQQQQQQQQFHQSSHLHHSHHPLINNKMKLHESL